MSSSQTTSSIITQPLISAKAQEKKWDVFIYNENTPDAARSFFNLLAGFSSETHSLTAESLLRWISILFPDLSSPVIQGAAVIEMYGVLEYRTLERVDLKDLSSTMAPGNYVIQTLGPASHTMVYLCLADLPNYWSSDEDSVPTPQQSSGVCVITKSAHTRTVWIIPPSSGIAQDAEIPESDARGLSNTLTLNTTLADAFERNLIGFDVDENYLLVTFEPLPGKTLALVGEGIADELAPSAMFLRLHFKHCLQVNLLGGDIHVDHNEHQIAQLFEELNELSKATLDDPRFRTRLGRAMLPVIWKNILAELPQAGEGSGKAEAGASD
ncbi:hypothetical protein C8J56DRAFT_1164997 [Mycena floridula]|nr:hypothetical protein C8J56DRAFT_1164997 [Mycena floridula]